jgi:tRNA A-37 threonylcarbamoyl transferase component Bud32
MNPILEKPFPFDLPLEVGVLRCQKLLRAIPGTRLVIIGEWQQKPVLAKIFLKPLQGWLQLQRLQRGASALIATGNPTPPILYLGRIKRFKVCIVLFEFIEGLPFNEAFNGAILLFERWILLRQFVETLAKQHEAGIEQTDLHFKNFLWAKNKLYSLDTGSICVRRTPLSEKKSLLLFASMLAQFSQMDTNCKSKAITWYFQTRGWLKTPKLLRYLDRQNARRQRKRENDLRTKLFRTSTKFASEKNNERFWVCDRRYLNDELLTFLKTPDYLFLSRYMHIIKEDSTTTVGVIQIGEQWFLVKRYNMKNFWHRLKRAITKTRAAKSWENAQRLLFRGIRTPQPIAIIENRWGIFKGVCYFISAYVPAMTATEYFKPYQFDLAEGGRIAEQILEVLQTLTIEKIFHGDLKATNILINGEGIWLVDLDAMRFYRTNIYFKRRAIKDKTRFAKNWQGQPLLKNLFNL